MLKKIENIPNVYQTIIFLIFSLVPATLTVNHFRQSKTVSDENIHNFEPIKATNIINTSKSSNLTFQAILGIQSKENRLANRNAARRTWLKNANEYGFTYKFILDERSEDLILENSRFGDLIFINSTRLGRYNRFGERLFRWLRYAII